MVRQSLIKTTIVEGLLHLGADLLEVEVVVEVFDELVVRDVATHGRVARLANMIGVI